MNQFLAQGSVRHIKFVVSVLMSEVSAIYILIYKDKSSKAATHAIIDQEKLSFSFLTFLLPYDSMRVDESESRKVESYAL